MANKFFPRGAQKVLGASINLATDTIKAALVPDSYTYTETHEYLNQLGTIVGAAVELTGKTVVGGVFDADDPAFGALAAGSTVKAVVLFKDTGNPATSPLVCYLDVITGFPFSTNGGTVSANWSDGSAKILSLV
ncbi:DUF2190 domain-containing protein [Comamonas aquatilis]|uniref:hypothetical protein n=1 Tax=Comamonas aquatilis TaxID=1778406 RepID=UPI0039EF97B4